MKVEDCYIQNRRGWVRLHEKGGKVNELPCHHNFEKYLDAWLTASRVRGGVDRSPLSDAPARQARRPDAASPAECLCYDPTTREGRCLRDKNFLP